MNLTMKPEAIKKINVYFILNVLSSINALESELKATGLGLVGSVNSLEGELKHEVCWRTNGSTVFRTQTPATML